MIRAVLTEIGPWYDAAESTDVAEPTPEQRQEWADRRAAGIAAARQQTVTPEQDELVHEALLKASGMH